MARLIALAPYRFAKPPRGLFHLIYKDGNATICGRSIRKWKQSPMGTEVPAELVCQQCHSVVPYTLVNSVANRNPIRMRL